VWKLPCHLHISFFAVFLSKKRKKEKKKRKKGEGWSEEKEREEKVLLIYKAENSSC